MREQRLGARQAGDARGRGDALVERREPPGARAAHAHAGRADAAGVDVRPRGEIVERDQVVAHHHRPQAGALPEKRLGEAGLLVASRLAGSAGPASLTRAERPRVDGEDGVAAARERHGRRLAHRPGLEQLLEPDRVVAPVRVVPGDRRPGSGAVARQQDDGGDLYARAVVEQEVLAQVRRFAVARDGDRAHAGGARGRTAEKPLERTADLAAPARPGRQRRRHAERRWARRQCVGSCARASCFRHSPKQEWFQSLRSKALLLKSHWFTGAGSPCLMRRRTMPRSSPDQAAQRLAEEPLALAVAVTCSRSARRVGELDQAVVEERVPHLERVAHAQAVGHHEQRLQEDRRLDARSGSARRCGRSRQRGAKKSSSSGHAGQALAADHAAEALERRCRSSAGRACRRGPRSRRRARSSSRSRSSLR